MPLTTDLRPYLANDAFGKRTQNDDQKTVTTRHGSLLYAYINVFGVNNPDAKMYFKYDVSSVKIKTYPDLQPFLVLCCSSVWKMRACRADERFFFLNQQLPIQFWGGTRGGQSHVRVQCHPGPPSGSATASCSFSFLQFVLLITLNRIVN